ncbi:MAG: glutamine amidotransferase [Cyanobacteria bacterium P01_A01_bin.123]
MKNALVIVHQDTSDSGRIGQILSQRGYQLDQRCPAIGDALPETREAIAAYDAIVVFGGPMSANDDDTLPFIRQEMDLIAQVVKAERPFLGICLGAQLLARVLGSRVSPHPDAMREIGYHPIDPTSAGQAWFDQPMHVYQWHKEGFDLPAGATLLATGQTFVNQAFRYGKSAYGLQFHPEITRNMIETWTTKAADQLVLPGAKSQASHFSDHDTYEAEVCRWLNQFIDQWFS